MKIFIIFAALLALAACQTTRTPPTKNSEGLYVITDAKGEERILPLCYERDENGKLMEGNYTDDELVTIIQYGCTPREE